MLAEVVADGAFLSVGKVFKRDTFIVGEAHGHGLRSSSAEHSLPSVKISFGFKLVKLVECVVAEHGGNVLDDGRRVAGEQA